MHVLITGSSGFFGSHLVDTFRRAGHEVYPLPSVICDLRDLKQTQTALMAVRPDTIIHAAAMCGGIAFNAPRQAESLYNNCLMNLQTLEAARLTKVRRFINISSSCAYPDLDEPLVEENLWGGLPYQTNIGYGIAKRLQQLQGVLYNEQYDMDVTTVFLPNLYGEHDHFGTRSHVVAALIKRFVVATEKTLPEVSIWGTGDAVRELMYASDAAEGVLRVTEHEPIDVINLGTGIGHTIREIAETISLVTEFDGVVTYDDTKPGGQTSKIMDVTRMKTLLGWVPSTGLQDGIKRTAHWYLAHRTTHDAEEI